MAINQFFEESMHNLGGVIFIHARGTGAGTSDMTAVKGVTSIVRASAGTYTVTLPRKFSGLLNCVGQVIDVTTPDDWEVNLGTDLTNGNTLTVTTWKGGIAADLSTDEKILLTIILRNSNTKPAGF